MAKARKKAAAKKPLKLSANTTRKVKANRGRSEPGTVKAKARGLPPKCGAAKSDRRGTPKGKATRAGGPGGGKGARKSKGRIGNPPHQPSDELRKIAETHAAVGTPHWAIAAEMGISEDTLERHYRRELDMGLIRMNARIGSSVAKKALEGDADMQKFWLGRRGGEAWTNKTQLSTPPGRPLETRDMTGLSDDELAALAALDRNAARRD